MLISLAQAASQAPLQPILVLPASARVLALGVNVVVYQQKDLVVRQIQPDRILWKKVLKNPILTAVGTDQVDVTSSGPQGIWLQALQLKTGKTLWKKTFNQEPSTLQLVAGVLILEMPASPEFSQVLALNPKNGKPLWSTRFAGAHSVAEFAGQVYLQYCSGGTSCDTALIEPRSGKPWAEGFAPAMRANIACKQLKQCQTGPTDRQVVDLTSDPQVLWAARSGSALQMLKSDATFQVLTWDANQKIKVLKKEILNLDPQILNRDHFVLPDQMFVAQGADGLPGWVSIGTQIFVLPWVELSKCCHSEWLP
ncbi:hypothetical protein GCM10008938_22510 [Deinococcus roseus]|uniref:Pyrrolo-quinoline quinone repeat domain-containing protein n=2 Tax=Deinococcus roseus TaxID=392414 RepID=A0ABQ2D1P1_9DEIO|nr:hypothetical protein GCM10008938_22510 [Deinococcus roseus]